MSTPTFIGRKKELARLHTMHQQNKPSLVVITGRRRIGKSRLIHFFASQQTSNTLWSFAGLAPQEDMDAQDQRDHFARQLAEYLNIPPFTVQDWTDAFEHLGQHMKANDIVLLDEISWMGAKDPSFVPKLKAWWDKQQVPVMGVLCGSVSTWIEDNILNSTAFFGRINLTIALKPLPIPEATQLLHASGFQGSEYDTYQLLSILGGVPWYLEQITSGITAEHFIKQLCFEKDGLLVLEFRRIFHDLFHGKGAAYKLILNSLAGGMKTLADIRKDTGFPHSGTLSLLVEHLISAGFVQKQSLWSFKTLAPRKQSLYRICDPYMRFYLKLIAPNRTQIDMGGFQQKPLSTLSGFEAHIGFQMEQLLLQNSALLLKAIGVDPTDIVNSGPFRQKKNSTQAGCQIDYLVQTKTHNLYLCEFKFKRRELGVEIIEHMQEKIKALQVPKGFATIPILFHIGGVSGNLATQDYFYRIIDIADFLNAE